jgi:hypothetical protein
MCGGSDPTRVVRKLMLQQDNIEAKISSYSLWASECVTAGISAGRYILVSKHVGDRLMIINKVLATIDGL